MAKISENNRRFRSKELMCSDLCFVLSSNLSYGTKYAVSADIIWSWTEFSGKISGCKYWSDNAFKSKLIVKNLIHEHVVPKNVLINSLINRLEISYESIHKYLERFCIGVVVTKIEDKLLTESGLRSSMPIQWDGNDPWARYKQVGIRVQKIDI